MTLLWQFAMVDEKREECQMKQRGYAITSPVLIPLSEPQQGSNLLRREAAQSQHLRCFNGRLRLCCDVLSVRVHHRVIAPESPATTRMHIDAIGT